MERSSIEKAPYYALTSYEINKGPLVQELKREYRLELLEDYSLIGKKCFLETAKKIQEL